MGYIMSAAVATREKNGGAVITGYEKQVRLFMLEVVESSALLHNTRCVKHKHVLLSDSM